MPTQACGKSDDNMKRFSAVVEPFRASLRNERSSLRSSARLLVMMGAARLALFVAFLVLLKKMGSAQFGTFFLGYNTLAMVPLLLDFGIGQTFVRHISFYQDSRPQFAGYLQWLFFALRAWTVAILAIVVWPVVPLAAKFLNLKQQQPLLTVAILGSGAVILFEYVSSIFQSQCMFRRYEAYIFLRNCLFLLAVVALLAVAPGLLSPMWLMVCVVLIHLALVASAYPAVSKRWNWRAGTFNEFRPYLVRYSKWLSAAAVCVALYRRMDLYYLSHFRTLHDVGNYSLAVVLAEPVATVSPALFTVLLPKLAAEPTAGRIARHFRLSALLCAALAVGVTAYLGALRFAFPFFGPQYREAFPAACLLLFGSVFLIGYNLLSLVFLATDHPEVLGQIALAMAVFSLIVNWFAVPAYGVLGAAAVYGLSQILGILIATFRIRRLLHHGKLFLRVATETMVPAEPVLT
jgi:O-antigen/teichoic acid export membrane protein